MKKNRDKDKIGLGEKLAFMMGGAAAFPINNMMATYLLIFYTDVIGLKMGAVATMMLLSKIFDAVNDPLTGFLIDHLPRTKWGRYRGYLILGSLMAGINFFFLWWAPFVVPDAVKLVVVYITYFLMGVTFDFASVPASAMLVVETPKQEERMSLSVWKTLGQYVGVAISMLVPFVLEVADDAFMGYMYAAIVMIVFAVVSSVIGFAGTRERVTATEEETHYSIKELFKAVTFKPVLVTMIAMLFIGVASNFSLITYYFTYVIDDLTLVTWTQVPPVFGLILALVFCVKLSDKFGRKKVYVISAIAYCVACLLRLLDPTNVSIIMFVTFVQGWLGGAGVVILYAIQADTIDIMEYQKGFRAEGAVLSLSSLVSKMGGAFGSTIPAYILAWCGYKEAIGGVAQPQTDFVVNAIILLTIFMPIVFFGASALVYGGMYKYSDNDMRKINAELEARRERKQK